MFFYLVLHLQKKYQLKLDMIIEINQKYRYNIEYIFLDIE